MTSDDAEDIKLFHNHCTCTQFQDLTEYDLRWILRCLESFKLEHFDVIEGEKDLITFEYLENRIRKTYHFLYMRNRYNEFLEKRNRDRRLDEEREERQNALRAMWSYNAAEAKGELEEL